MDFDWVHNWDLARGCIRGVIEQTGVDPHDIAAVSTTCMREGIVLYDKEWSGNLGLRQRRCAQRRRSGASSCI
jgi:sugar (pentulose or hexulose) kinase